MHTPYVYRLTDRVTGKRYIGSRYAARCQPEDLGVSYFTSSSVVSKLFKSDPARFDKHIIVTGAVEYVINVERTMIDLYGAVISEQFYNRANQKAIHPDDTRRAGNKCKVEKIGFHAFTFEEFSEHNKKNGFKSLADRKGVHARTKEQMRADGMKSFDMKVGVHSRTKEQMSETGTLNGLRARDNKTGFFSFTQEQRQEVGKTYGGMSTKPRYKCACCEMVTTAAGLGNHFRKTGHTGKVLIQQL